MRRYQEGRMNRSSSLGRALTWGGLLHLLLLLLPFAPLGIEGGGVSAQSGRRTGIGAGRIGESGSGSGSNSMNMLLMKLRGGGEGGVSTSASANAAVEQTGEDGGAEEIEVVENKNDEEESDDDKDEEEEETTTTAEVNKEDGEEEYNDDEEEEEDDEEEETNQEATSSVAIISSEQAHSLRLQGKQAHDQGEFEVAADLFSQAAQALLLLIPPISSSSEEEEEEDPEDEEKASKTVEEYATCRLHQALCYLKSHHYEQCLETCSELLESNSTPITTTTETTNTATTTPTNHATRPVVPYSSAIRARAYHRRAKARLGLDMPTLALDDARAAAFLGDAKAVQLYGKLMRQWGGGGSSSSDDGGASSSSDGLLQALLSKSTATTTHNGDTSTSSAFSPASLLFGGAGSNGNLASSLLNSLTGSKGSTSATASSSLASSVLKSLAKRLDDPTTHTSVASFLQQTTKTQLSQYATMAGLAIPDVYLEQVAALCQAVTARKILWTIKLSKVAIFITQFVRRVAKIMRKYRSLILCLVLLQWTKSAILRPIPVDRVASKKAARHELSKAFKDSAGAKK